MNTIYLRTKKKIELSLSGTDRDLHQQTSEVRETSCGRTVNPRLKSAHLLTAGPPYLIYLFILTLSLFWVGLPLPLHLHLEPQFSLIFDEGARTAEQQLKYTHEGRPVLLLQG